MTGRSDSQPLNDSSSVSSRDGGTGRARYRDRSESVERRKRKKKKKGAGGSERMRRERKKAEEERREERVRKRDKKGKKKKKEKPEKRDKMSEVSYRMRLHACVANDLSTVELLAERLTPKYYVDRRPHADFSVFLYSMVSLLQTAPILIVAPHVVGYYMWAYFSGQSYITGPGVSCRRQNLWRNNQWQPRQKLKILSGNRTVCQVYCGAEICVRTWALCKSVTLALKESGSQHTSARQHSMCQMSVVG